MEPGNHDVYHIPSNFTDAGRVLGLFEIRNTIEAVLLTLPIIYLCLRFLPLTLTGKIVAALALAIPIGGFSLIGIMDESLGRWLCAWWRWRRRRRKILYRGEILPK